jgi:ketosteroid isomerase-like protein
LDEERRFAWNAALLPRDTAWAMSEENIELAQRASEMFNRRDLHGFLALMAEDVKFQPQMGPRSEGHDGMRRLWNNLIGGPGFTVEVVRLRDLGADLVLAAVHARGEGVGAVEQTYWVPSRWRQGECFWWGVFLDEQDALEAAGLRE